MTIQFIGNNYSEGTRIELVPPVGSQLGDLLFYVLAGVPNLTNESDGALISTAPRIVARFCTNTTADRVTYQNDAGQVLKGICIAYRGAGFPRVANTATITATTSSTNGSATPTTTADWILNFWGTNTTAASLSADTSIVGIENPGEGSEGFLITQQSPNTTSAVAGATATATAAVLTEYTRIVLEDEDVPYNLGTFNTKSATSHIVNVGTTTTVRPPANSTVWVSFVTSATPTGLTVTDQQNHTYSLVSSVQLNNTAANGTLYLYRATVTTPISGFITVSASNAVIMATSVWGTKKNITQVQVAPVTSFGSSTTPSVTRTSVIGGWAFGIVATVGPSGDAFTQATNYLAPPTRVGTTGGNAATNRTLAGGWDIFSGVTSKSYAPTLGTSRAWGAILVVYGELPQTTQTDSYEEENPGGSATDVDALIRTPGTGTVFALETVNGYGNRFIAPNTGQLGPVTVRGYVDTANGTAVPTTQGTVQLIDFNTNQVIASQPISFVDNSIPGLSKVFQLGDFSSNPNAVVTAGTTYAVVIYGGSDWGVSRKNLVLVGYQDTGNPPRVFVQIRSDVRLATRTATNLFFNTSATAAVSVRMLSARDSSDSVVNKIWNLLQSEGTSGTASGIWPLLNESSSSSNNITGTAGFGNRFTATASGRLGEVYIRAFGNTSSGTTLPSTQGTLELYRESTSQVIATQAVPFIDLPTLSANQQIVQVGDFTNVIAANVIAGEVYQVRLRGGSDWGVSTKTISYTSYASFNSDIVRDIGLAAFNRWVLVNSQGDTTVSGSGIAALHANYAGAGDAAFTDAAPEVVAESVTATDSATRTVSATTVASEQAFAYITQRPLGAGGIISPDESFGQRFIAPISGPLGSVTFALRRGNTGNPLPSTDGSIEIWQLASNSLTAFPQTLLASVPMNFSSLSTIVSSDFATYLFSNVTLTAGVGYAVVVKTPSTLSSSTQSFGYQFGRASLSATDQYFYSIYGPIIGRSGAGAWTDVGSSAQDFLEIQVTVRAATEQQNFFTIDVSQTESVTASDSADSSVQVALSFINGTQTKTAASSINYAGSIAADTTMFVFIVGSNGPSGVLTDSVGNTYTYVSGGAGGISTGGIFFGVTAYYCKVTNAISTGTTLTERDVFNTINSSITGYQAVRCPELSLAELAGKVTNDIANVSASTLSITNSGLDTAKTYLSVTAWMIGGPSTDTISFNAPYSGVPQLQGTTGGSASSNVTFDGANSYLSGVSTTTATITNSAARILVGTLFSIPLGGTSSAITESVTVTDSSTCIETANAFLTEGSNLIPYFKSNTVDTTGGGYGYGLSFIPTSSGTFNLVSVGITKIPTTAPSTSLTVELWTLASNSLTATLQTQIGSVSFSYAQVPTSGGIIANFSSQNISYTSGTAYAVVVRTGSDWSSINIQIVATGPIKDAQSQFSRGIFIHPNPDFNGYDNFALDARITNVNSTLDSALAGGAVAGARTESVTANDSSTSTVVRSVTAAETVTATDSQDSTAAATASQSETVTAGHNQTRQLDAVVSRTEALAADESSVDDIYRLGETTDTLNAEDAAVGRVAYTVDAAETVTATDTQDSTAAATASQSETLAAAVAEEAQLDAVADRTEAGTAAVAEESQLDTAASTEETVTASDSSVGSINYEVDAAEAVTAADSQDFTYAANAEATESVTASDSSTQIKSSLGIASEGVVLDLWVKRGFWVSSSIFGSPLYRSQNFIAPKTTQLGVVRLGLWYQSTAPTVDGELQLWQLASNSGSALPQTLLATAPIRAASIPTYNDLANLAVSAVVDFTLVPGASVTAGVGYAVVIKADSSWTTVRFTQHAQSNDPSYASVRDTYSSLNLAQSFSSNGVTWNTASTDPLLFVISESNTLDQLAGSSTTTTSITEAVSTADEADSTAFQNNLQDETLTATDSSDNIVATTADITESVTATDSAAPSVVARAWFTETNNVPGSPLIPLTSGNTYFAVTSNTSLGARFLAQNTGQIRGVRVRSPINGTYTSGSMDVQIWSLASNSPTALPATLLGSVTVPASQLNGLSLFNFDLTPANVNIVQGTYYSLVLTNFSLSPGTQFTWGTPDINNSIFLYNYSLASGAVGGVLSNYGFGWSVSAPAIAQFTIDVSNNTSEVALSGLVSSSDTTEAVSTADEADSTAFQNNFQDETLDATDSSDNIVATTATATETITATDAGIADRTARAWVREEYIQQDLITGSLSTNSAATTNNNLRIAQSFIANRTGVVRNVRVGLTRMGSGTFPTSGTIEIWQLASNSVSANPQTLLASVPMIFANLPTVSGTITNYSFGGVTLTQGVGYAIVIATPDTLSASGYSLVYSQVSVTNDPAYNYFKPFNQDLRTNNSGSSIWSTNLGGRLLRCLVTIEAASEAQESTYTTTTDITETAAATDSSDNFTTQEVSAFEVGSAADESTNIVASNADITESVAATDTNIQLAITARAWIDEGDTQVNTLFGFNTVSGLTYNTGASSFGHRFIASRTGVVGNVALSIYRSLVGNPLPTDDGTVEIWQLASNSLTAFPQTLLASVPMNFASLSTSSSVPASYYFGNVTLTAGVGYAVVAKTPSTLTASTQHLIAGILTPGLVNQTEVSYVWPYAARYLERLSTNWTNQSVFILKAYVSLDDAVDSATQTLTVPADITETATATEDSSTVLAAVGEVAEVEIATDAVTAVYDAVSEITETLSVLDAQEVTRPVIPALVNAMPLNTLTLNATGYYRYGVITEAESAQDTPTASYTTFADTAETLTADDTLACSLVSDQFISEDAAAADDVASLVVFNGLLTETLTAVVFETSQLAAVAANDEALFITDNQTSQGIFVNSVSEPLTTTDQANSSRVSSHSASEAVSGSDSQDNFVAFVSDRTESTSAADSQISLANFVGQASDSLTVVDTLASQANFIASESEALNITDNVSGIFIMGAQQVELAAANDSVFSQLIITVEVVDPLAASDSSLGGSQFLASGSALALVSVNGNLLYTPFIDLEYVLSGPLAAAVEDGFVLTAVELDETEPVVTNTDIAISQDIDYINAYASPSDIQMSVEVLKPDTVSEVEYVRLAGAA